MLDPASELNKRLDLLTVQLEKQNSLWGMLVRGIFYGVGFVIGSVVLAAILIGIFLPFVKDIPGVRQAFQSGSGVLQQSGSNASTTH